MEKELVINGVKVTNLKKEFGTPLYIYDENKIRENILEYKNNLKSKLFETEVIFASKSFNVKEMLRICKELGISLDCVSYGELFTAKEVDYDPTKIYMHGNNKSIEELVYCIDHNVNIVVDNLMELEMINSLAKEKEVALYIRLNVGVDAHTHKYIVTGHIDSKFGVIYNSEDYKEMMKIISSNTNLKLVGFHAHIGSQIFDEGAFYAEIDKLVSYLKDFSYPLNLDLGGGFGVTYTDDDKPIPFHKISKLIVSHMEEALKRENVRVNKVLIEPGRSIVAECGYTLYTIGFMKKTPNKRYYFVDGGMTDNIRPALYQAKYSVDVATQMDKEKNVSVCVAGNCCESGDIIVENAMLQEANTGDLIITYTTGAYGYSMSSNYNKALTPAVVFIKDGKARSVVKRQTYAELIEREV